MAFFRDNEQLVGSRTHEENKVEVRFRGSKGDHGRKRAVMVRTRTGRGWREEGGAVDPLVELFRLYSIRD